MVAAPAMGLSLSRPTHVWNSYCQALEKQPLITKSLTSVVGFALGDIVAQATTRSNLRRPKRFDVARTLRMATFGGAVGGPMGHYWFQYLDKAVLPLAPKSPAAVFSKIGLDQLIMAPVGTLIFFASQQLMQGQPQTIRSQVKDKLWPTTVAGYKLWPLAHLINFALIPPAQRVLYVNIVSVGWTCILSQA
ncbi:hypothetical protein WJX84_009969, partial [Apatococcus fuscideae]